MKRCFKHFFLPNLQFPDILKSVGIRERSEFFFTVPVTCCLPVLEARRRKVGILCFALIDKPYFAPVVRPISSDAFIVLMWDKIRKLTKGFYQAQEIRNQAIRMAREPCGKTGTLLPGLKCPELICEIRNLVEKLLSDSTCQPT